MAKHYKSTYGATPRRRDSRDAQSWMGTRMLVIALLVLILGGGLGKIFLDRQTGKLRQQWNDRNEQLKLAAKESENLQLELEKFMHGDYVLPRARRFGLRPSEPGQVRALRSRPEATGDSGPAIAVR